MGKFLNRLRLPNLSATPSPSPAESEIWYDISADQVKYRSVNYNLGVQFGTRFNDYATGRWYQTQTGMSTATALVNSRCYATPIVCPRTAVMSGTAVEVTTAFATTVGSIRVGIYDDVNLTPTNRLADFGTVAASVGVKVFTNGYSFSPGIYWLVMAVQGAAGTAGQIRTVQGQHEFIGDTASTPNMNGNLNCYYTDTGMSGAFPSTFGTVAGMVAGPRFAVRFSA